jgi:hypothetical protein
MPGGISAFFILVRLEKRGDPEVVAPTSGPIKKRRRALDPAHDGPIKLQIGPCASIGIKKNEGRAVRLINPVQEGRAEGRLSQQQN